MANIKTRLLGGVCATLLASCSVHVDPITDARLTETAARELAEMFPAAQSIEEPLGLDAVIERAVVNNLDNRLSRLEQSFTLLQVDVDSLEMLPTLAANAGYSNRSRDSFTTSQVLGEERPDPPSFSRSRDAEGTTATLSTTWNVLDFTLGYYNARQAGNRAFIAEERARRAGMDIIRQARQTFWRAYAAQQLSGTIEDTIAEANRVLNLIREGEERGAIPAVEALQSRRTVLENVRQLEIFNRDLAAAQIELAQIVNVRPGAQVELATSSMSIPSLPGSLSELEARAFTSNPTLREQQYRINIALDDLKRTTAQLFPELSFSATTSYDGDSFLLNDSWNQFGLNAGWNLLRLLTGPQRRGLSERGVDVERARALALRMTVLAQTQIAYRDFIFSRNQFARAQELAEIDRQLAQQSRAREQASVGSLVERVAVETSTLVSQLRVYDAYSDLVAAHAAVMSTIGANDAMTEALARHQEKYQRVLSDLDAADSNIALETASIEDLGRQDARLQRSLVRAELSFARAKAAQDAARTHRDELRDLAASSNDDGMPDERLTARLQRAEANFARTETDLALATAHVDDLTQQVAALALARAATEARLHEAETLRDTAHQQIERLGAL
ncbi:TolC family protein [Paradonghicola geojensis]|nr:TolC family protein [Marivivens geojensis]